MAPDACPDCASQEWTTSEQGTLTCKNCGTSFSEVDRVLDRHTSPAKPRWLQRARDQAADIKDLEEASSKQRLDKLIEIDRKREDALRLEKARQDQQEQRTLSATIIFTAIILVIIVIATLVITLRG